MADSPPGGLWALGQPPKGETIDETVDETIDETMGLLLGIIARIGRNITNITRFARIY